MQLPVERGNRRLEVANMVRRFIKLGIFIFSVCFLSSKQILAKEISTVMVYAVDNCYIYEKDMEHIVGVLEHGNVAYIKNRQGHVLEIQSGTIQGYIKNKGVLTGKQAEKEFEKNAKKKIEVIYNHTFVYEDKEANGRIIDILTKGEEISLVEETNLSYEIVSDIELQGYVKKDEVKINPVYEYASKASNAIEYENYSEYTSDKEYDQFQGISEEETTIVADETKTTGEQIIQYARQFLGNPYVWGGTSLTKGADCSGFIQAIYQHFNIELPRTSFEMRGSGTLIMNEWEEKKALPGDIICYDGHVALYCGDGTIIHAASKKTGVIISKEPNYRPVLCVRRILGNENQKNQIELDEESKEILYRIVEAEAGVEDFEGKKLIARVILNRIEHSKFPNSVKKVVYAKKGNVYQFSPVKNGKIDSVTVSSETVKAVKEVLEGEDNSKGALYFMARKFSNPLAVKWFDSSLTYLFTHGGHEFYK